MRTPPQASRLLDKFGFASWPAVARLGEETRKFHREDLRAVRKRSGRELSLVGDILSFLRKCKPRMASSKGRREPPYAELAIPQNTERWFVDLCKLTGA